MNYAFRRPREVNLDAECFAVEVVDHVEQTDIAPIGHLVVHEIHRWARHDQWLRRLPDQPRAQLDPQFSSSSQ